MTYVAAPEKLHSQGSSLFDVTQSQSCEQPHPWGTCQKQSVAT